MNALLHDNLAGIRQIKSYTAEPEEHERFNQASDKLRRATLRAMFAWAIYHPSMYALGTLGILIVTGFGGWMVIDGTIKPGHAGELHFPARIFLRTHRQAAQPEPAPAIRPRRRRPRVRHPRRRRGKPHGPRQTAGKASIRGHVVFDGVTFSYGDRPTLHEVSLEALPGQTIALVGTTGAGKSTVINLLTRFYEYDAGRILIDGHEIHAIAKPSLRDAIGYVTQESFMFNGSVRENLLLGKRDASEAECWTALAAANADAFVKRLPDQLDTVVGERGIKLSVGERQRLSIARAILKNPPHPAPRRGHRQRGHRNRAARSSRPSNT